MSEKEKIENKQDEEFIIDKNEIKENDTNTIIINDFINMQDNNNNQNKIAIKLDNPKEEKIEKEEEKNDIKNEIKNEIKTEEDEINTNENINIIIEEKQNNNKINNINNIKIDEEHKQSNDLLSKKFEVHNDDDKYLVQLDEDQELENLLNEHNNNSSDEDDDEEETFPFRVIGDVQKKGESIGKYNHRYLEIDSVKGILKRYKSVKEYPRRPLEIVPIKNLKNLKKCAKDINKDCYDFEITFTLTKGNKTEEKVQRYRVRHAESRTKWYDSLLTLWKYLVKGEKMPKINNHKLEFVDDQAGIIQDIKQHNDKSKTKSGKISLKNFKILGILGVGGFSTVYKVRHIMTEKVYAMKVMNKNYIISKKYLHYVVSEFEIMKDLSGFPFVLDLHYCFQSANYLYMIIDYCPNGDFNNLGCINNLKLFFAEVILAFEHIHKHHTVYRDLKPENIILDETGHIKICDFNLAKSGITKGKRAMSFCGSPMYLSPDMLSGLGVDQKCDIYGIGLIMYELVSGFPTFTADDIDTLYKDIKVNKINFDRPGITGEIKDLLQKILVLDPEKRITLDEMKKHEYFKDISFLKVYKKQYGPIKIKKKDKNSKNSPVLVGEEYFVKTEEQKVLEEKLKKAKEHDNYIQFKAAQLKLDEDKNFTFLDGKISVKEMKKDQKRDMKNYVREFYFVKKEDVKQNIDFHLTVNEKPLKEDDKKAK